MEREIIKIIIIRVITVIENCYLLLEFPVMSITYNIDTAFKSIPGRLYTNNITVCFIFLASEKQTREPHRKGQNLRILMSWKFDKCKFLIYILSNVVIQYHCNALL